LTCSRICPNTADSPESRRAIFEGSFNVARAMSSIVAIPEPPPVMIMPAGSSPFFPIFFK